MYGRLLNQTTIMATKNVELSTTTEAASYRTKPAPNRSCIFVQLVCINVNFDTERLIYTNLALRTHINRQFVKFEWEKFSMLF